MHRSDLEFWGLNRTLVVNARSWTHTPSYQSIAVGMSQSELWSSPPTICGE